MKIALLIILLFSNIAISDEVDVTLEKLGQPVSDIDNLLSAYCFTGWEMSVPNNVLSDKKMFVYRSVQTEMFEITVKGSSKSTIKAGKSCSDLWDYYLNGSITHVSIKRFIDADAEFVSRYGYSSIDLWGLKRYKSASINGKENAPVLTHWEVLREKGLISISEEGSMFNGKKSKAYFSSITEKGKKLLEALNK